MSLNNNCLNNETLINEFNSLLDIINLIGQEEGCPLKLPLNFDLFLTIPSAKMSSSSSSQSSSNIAIPLARPLPKDEIDEIEESNNNECLIEQQQKFQLCVSSLSSFQPHPLSVIKNPRQIVDACISFNNYLNCSKNLLSNCIPLWARGLTAMFEFACGEGNEKFIEHRQCIKRSTVRPELHECVLSFSRASPHEACKSSKNLIECAIPFIESKCGLDAVKFEKDYVGRFAKALDSNCLLFDNNLLNNNTEVTVFTGLNCSNDQKHLINQCSEPLGELRTQLDKMFKGGLQSVLKNLNSLATLFEKGCTISSQFRKCINSIYSIPTNCTISSCLIASGVGICDQPNVGEAIDNNLGCVFRQVSNPEFGQCIRQHLGPLRQFNLSGLRSVLPNFVDCVEPIVLKSCGNIPLNVLRVLASNNSNCPKIDENIETLPTSTLVQPICTDEMRKTRQICQNNYLLSKYQFQPILLLNISNNDELNQFCLNLDKLEECEKDTKICDFEEPYGQPRAMKSFSIFLCSSKTEYIEINTKCLLKIKLLDEYKNCLNNNNFKNDQDFCNLINKTTHCISSKLFNECGTDDLDFIFKASNEFVGQLIPSTKCHLETPAVSLQTGCTEQQLVNYLECETLLDKYRPRPISLISNQTQWDDFCSNAYNKFKKCVEVLECRPQPATKATLTLYETVCEREITLKDQRKFGNCLYNITETDKGQKCLTEFRSIDLLAKDTGENVCKGINKLLQCLAKQINLNCGEEALLHVYDLNNIWANEFYKGCSLSPPEIEREEKKILPKIDFSSDQNETKHEVEIKEKMLIKNKIEQNKEEHEEKEEQEFQKEEEENKISEKTTPIWAEEIDENEEKIFNSTTTELNKNNNLINNGIKLKYNIFFNFLFIFIILDLFWIY